MPVLFARCREDEHGDVLCQWDVKFLMSCDCVVARCWEDKRSDSLCQWDVKFLMPWTVLLLGVGKTSAVIHYVSEVLIIMCLCCC